MSSNNSTLKKPGALSDLLALAVYGTLLVITALYLWRCTSDNTWGPNGVLSYEFPTSARIVAGLVAIAFVGFRFAIHVRRYFRPTTNI